MVTTSPSWATVLNIIWPCGYKMPSLQFVPFDIHFNCVTTGVWIWPQTCSVKSQWLLTFDLWQTNSNEFSLWLKDEAKFEEMPSMQSGDVTFKRSNTCFVTSQWLLPLKPYEIILVPKWQLLKECVWKVFPRCCVNKGKKSVLWGSLGSLTL